MQNSKGIKKAYGNVFPLHLCPATQFLSPKPNTIQVVCLSLQGHFIQTYLYVFVQSITPI